MNSLKMKIAAVLGWLLLIFVVPGVAYLSAKLYFLGLFHDKMTDDQVPEFDRRAFIGITFLASLGYGFGAWYAHTQNWSSANLFAFGSIINGFPLFLACLGEIELRQSQDSSCATPSTSSSGK